MAINIGNAAMKAIVELRGNGYFQTLVDELDLAVQKIVYASLTAPIEQRVDASAQARGMQEIVETLKAAHQGVRPVEVKKAPPPGPRMRVGGAASGGEQDYAS